MSEHPTTDPLLVNLIRLARPVEWLKNILVLVPLVFAGALSDAQAVQDALLAFAAFCLIASAGYAVNDVVDAPLDRNHPIKADRPVASGAVRPGPALAAAALAALAALGLAAAAGGLELIAVVAGYAALTSAYSLGLKRIVIVDVMAISGCFLLRVVGGVTAIGVTGSSWIYVCTASGALFLGFTKRRQEASSEWREQRSARPVLEHYSLPFLDQMVSLVTAMTIIGYTIYATEAPLAGNTMLLTVPPLLYALFRYLYLIYDRQMTGDAARLILRDPGMLAASATWLLTALAVIELS